MALPSVSTSIKYRHLCDQFQKAALRSRICALKQVGETYKLGLLIMLRRWVHANPVILAFMSSIYKLTYVPLRINV